MDTDFVQKHITEMVERLKYAKPQGADQRPPQQRALFDGISVIVNPGDTVAKVYQDFLEKKREEVNMLRRIMRREARENG